MRKPRSSAYTWLGLLGISASLAACPAPTPVDAGTDVVRPDATMDVAADIRNTDVSEAGLCTTMGGPVTGTTSLHCSADGGSLTQPTDPASCHVSLDGGHMHNEDVVSGSDAAAPSEYGETNFNAEADDDQCKYHMRWTATPICQGSDVFFTVTTTMKTDSTPTTGAEIRAEVFLSDTHPAPNTTQTVTESAPGVYRVGPVRFDAAGQWTVRFHLFEHCGDEPEDSPHGHGAFFVNVP